MYSTIAQAGEWKSLTVYVGAAVTLSWERFAKGIVSAAIVIRRSWEQFTAANETVLLEIIRLNYSNSECASFRESSTDSQKKKSH